VFLKRTLPNIIIGGGLLSVGLGRALAVENITVATSAFYFFTVLFTLMTTFTLLNLRILKLLRGIKNGPYVNRGRTDNILSRIIAATKKIIFLEQCLMLAGLSLPFMESPVSTRLWIMQ
jgi:1,4-dihydroxy-2-naphthoate octaprenyltransferase